MVVTENLLETRKLSKFQTDLKNPNKMLKAVAQVVNMTMTFYHFHCNCTHNKAIELY